ncbi:flavodoxin domain-containing protein [Anaerorhabdus sp.]|uniref:flavodoxin domain-containing protein n=1 Tax=Anaerorhabdus sp. TaxID=1872524 RepID=UPI002FCC2485
MKQGIVIYGSHYGATEQYAREIAKQTGFECIQFQDIKSLENYDTIVIGGGHYAGGITGLEKTMQKLPSQPVDVYIYSVGLSSKTKENLEKVNEAVRKIVPEEKVEDSHVFYYRGGMDMKKLSFIHKTMMRMMIGMIKKKPENELTSDDQGVIDLPNKAVDFVDVTQVNDLVRMIKG